jgi:hypothetical protein
MMDVKFKQLLLAVAGCKPLLISSLIGWLGKGPKLSDCCR